MSGPMILPWSGADVPHALLDLLRGCNVRCRDCYNTEAPLVKPLEQVAAELDLAMAARRLHTVSLIGGEPLLHPQLHAILRMIKARGLATEIFSNGLGLGPAEARELRRAGADFIVLHIESGQQRPDLEADTPRALRRLREAKAAVVTGAGMEAGLSITAYPEAPGEVEEALATTLDCPGLSFLLITLHMEAGTIPPLSGSLATGLHAAAPLDAAALAPFRARAEHLRALRAQLDARLGCAFAVLPSIAGPEDPRWLSYLAATVHRPGREARVRGLRCTPLEPFFNELAHRLAGRYAFYQPQDGRRNRIHLLLNGLLGGGLLGNLGLLAGASHRDASLQVKRILVQAPATLDAQGRLIHCRDCPDAVVRHGVLAPVCITDRVLPG